MNLVEAWKNWSKQDPLHIPDLGYVLEDDAKVLQDNHRKWQEKLFTYKDWKEATTDAAYRENRLHLGLVPNPFIGDVENASIYVLMANPHSWSAAYTGRDLSGLNKKFLANARQDFTGIEVRFVDWADQFGPFDPNAYWHERLRKTIERIARAKGLSYPEALKQVGNKLAVIQRSPYWSDNFVDGVEKLPSTQLAKDYVKDQVVPRARDGEAILIVARRLNAWRDSLPADYKQISGITAKTNRYGWLTPNTAGGQAILRHFGIPTDK